MSPYKTNLHSLETAVHGLAPGIVLPSVAVRTSLLRDFANWVQSEKIMPLFRRGLR